MTKLLRKAVASHSTPKAGQASPNSSLSLDFSVFYRLFEAHYFFRGSFSKAEALPAPERGVNQNIKYQAPAGA